MKIKIQWTQSQRKELKPLLDEVVKAATGKTKGEYGALLGQAGEYFTEIYFLDNAKAKKIQMVLKGEL